METLQTIVSKHLSERDFRFNFNPDKELFDFCISGNNGNWKVFIKADEERRLLQIVSVCPINSTNRQMAQMCELINRINDCVLLGKFSMDFEDGQVSLKTSSIYVGTELSDETLYHLLQTNINTFDEYLPAIIAVIYNHNQPLLAFLEVQNATN
jgi:hypothetical protein